MQKMLVPEALRADGSNFNLAVAAVYRREFELPAWKPDERVLLTFDDVVGELTVLLNGREAGRNHYKYKTYLGPEGEFLLDVTKYVRAGRNEIQLKFHHSGALLSWGFNRGIYGLVYRSRGPLSPDSGDTRFGSQRSCGRLSARRRQCPIGAWRNLRVEIREERRGFFARRYLDDRIRTDALRQSPGSVGPGVVVRIPGTVRSPGSQ